MSEPLPPHSGRGHKRRHQLKRNIKRTLRRLELDTDPERRKRCLKWIEDARREIARIPIGKDTWIDPRDRRFWNV